MEGQSLATKISRDLTEQILNAPKYSLKERHMIDVGTTNIDELDGTKKLYIQSLLAVLDENSKPIDERKLMEIMELITSNK
jgi:hypothetical protein